MKVYQRHIKASNEFIEGLVLGSLGLARSNVFNTAWAVNRLDPKCMVLTITLHAGKTVSLVDIKKMQSTVQSFVTLYNVHFGSSITLYFDMEKTETGGESVKLTYDKEETEEGND